MSEPKKKNEPPPASITIKRDDGPSSRTDRALEYQFDRTSIRERLRAAGEFRAKASAILGDRFMSRPEIKMLVETQSADLETSYGAGIRETDPLGHRNLNAGEWFLQEFARARRNLTVRNLTSQVIHAPDPDYGKPDHTVYLKDFQPGEIMRYGEDNLWTIEIGQIVIRLLHHNPFRSIPALEGRPQITLFKEEMVEKQPSWDKEKATQAPRTPEQT